MVDQRRIDNQPWVDAAAAARLLDVQRRTLYAYVSRGLLRSAPGPGGGRARLYLRDDLDRLRARHDARAGHGAVAAGALRWGEPVLDTAVSTIDARGPIYRERVACDLAARGVGFEAVTELLVGGALPARAPAWPRRAWPVAHVAAQLAPHAPPTAGLLPTALAMGLADPDRELAGAAELRPVIAALAASCARPLTATRVQAAQRAPTIAGVLAAALGARGSQAVHALDQALVLMADHELNASTFAGRVVASTGADLYTCLVGALAAHAGPLHGAASLRVEALVDECGTAARAAETLRERRRRGDALEGFGHRLYPGGDPRAAPLLAMAARLGARRPRVRVLLALVEAARAARLPVANVDVALVALADALGLPRGSAAAIFAVGRTAGWIAHAIEQRGRGVLLRPRARYVGGAAAAAAAATKAQ